MSLINVERIKLFSTRSPYWCLGSILVAALLFALLFGLVERGSQATPSLALRGVGLGETVFMVLAALAVTTEYRFSTIRVTFLAAPRRATVLIAKTALLAVLGAVIGFISAMAAFFLTKALAKDPPAPLVLEGEVWRETAGYAALFAVAAIIAVAVGTIVRQSAGAIAIVLIWPLLLESLVSLIPTVGLKIYPWLPFQAGAAFISSSEDLAGGGRGGPDVSHPGAVGGLLVFLGYAVVLWLIALLVLNKRDA